MFLNTWFVYVMASHRSLARDAHLQWHISYSFIDGNIISRRCAIYILVHISIYVAYYTCACVRCIRSPGYGQENWKTTVTRLQINCLFSLSLWETHVLAKWAWIYRCDTGEKKNHFRLNLLTKFDTQKIWLRCIRSDTSNR